MLKPKQKRLTAFQVIFSAAKVNGGEYRGDELQPRFWPWPESKVQKRIEELRRGDGQD